MYGFASIEKTVLIAHHNSHHHFDHIGDPSRFPPTTDLVVGPGFSKCIMPGYPKELNSEILESDYRWVLLCPFAVWDPVV